MATYMEPMRASDSYRKDGEKKSINWDKPKGKTSKIPEPKRVQDDKQK